MKKKIILWSIFAALLMLSMPVISSIQTNEQTNPKNLKNEIEQVEKLVADDAFCFGLFRQTVEGELIFLAVRARYWSSEEHRFVQIGNSAKEYTFKSIIASAPGIGTIRDDVVFDTCFIIGRINLS